MLLSIYSGYFKATQITVSATLRKGETYKAQRCDPSNANARDPAKMGECAGKYDICIKSGA